MPGTWAHWSKQVYGYVAEMTVANEWNVALYKIQYHLNEGHQARAVAAIWNSGSPNNWESKRGINKHGVAYDVPGYVRKVLAMM